MTLSRYPCIDFPSRPASDTGATLSDQQMPVGGPEDILPLQPLLVGAQNTPPA